MNEIEKMLRHGVKKIVSALSPTSMTDSCGSFQSSSHPRREICFVVEGFSRYMLNGSVYDSAPGTVFLIDKWVPHAFGYTADDHDLLHLWIFLNSPEMNACLVRVRENGEYRLDSKYVSFPDDCAHLLTRRWELLDAVKTAVSETAAEYMTAPLNTILDETAFQLFSREGQSELEADSVVLALKKHIRTMNARDCSYDKLERISGYHRSYLAHRFREAVGCSVGEYIEKIRIEYTAAAFRRGLKQKEVAFELGFSSPANFWSWLQKHKKAVEREEKRPDDPA